MTQKEDRIKKRKRFILKFSTVFIIVIIVLTLFSRTIDNFLLPSVMTTKYSSGVLDNSFYKYSSISISGVTTVNSSGSWEIANVQASLNKKVKKGDLLLIVKKDKSNDLNIEKKALEILQMENDIKEYKSDNKISKDIYEQTLKVKNLELSIKKDELEELRASSPVSGKVFAPIDGVVVSINVVQGDITSQNQPVIEIAGEDSKKTVDWTLNNRLGEKFDIGDSVYVELSGEGDDNNVYERESHEITGKEYLPDSDTYRFEAVIEDSEIEISDIKNVIVDGNAESQFYDCLIPKSCVIDRKDDIYVLGIRDADGVLGESKTTYKIDVEIVDSDDYYYALDRYSSLYLRDRDIILYSSKPLSENMRIKVR